MAKDVFRWFMYLRGGAIALLLIAAIVTAAWFGLFSSPTVTIRNESPLVVSNVVVSGNGFSELAGSIDPGHEKTVSMHPSGDSSVRVTFTAGEKQCDSGDQEYIAGNGDRFTATIDQNLSLKIRAVHR